MYELGRNHIQFCSLPPPVPILRVGRLLVSRGTHVAARERSGATSPTDREREDWCKRDVTRFAPPFSLISYLSGHLQGPSQYARSPTHFDTPSRRFHQLGTPDQPPVPLRYLPAARAAACGHTRIRPAAARRGVAIEWRPRRSQRYARGPMPRSRASSGCFASSRGPGSSDMVNPGQACAPRTAPRPVVCLRSARRSWARARARARPR